ncbi:MAG: hypothetical protein BWK76_03950 [Desulfobulbaceae bacterium A2]|nr:MAG: hypothetical protein BWK76_03950 [Desulfobulbaceae bacterium A2]
MNRAIEFHDSTITGVHVAGTEVTLALDAVIHQSAGIPGRNAGTCWLQRIHIHLHGAVVEQCPATLVNELSFGDVMRNGTKMENLLPLPTRVQGELVIMLATLYGERYQVRASMLETAAVGQPEDVQDFAGLPV